MNILQFLLSLCSFFLCNALLAYGASQKEPVGQNLVILLIDGCFILFHNFLIIINLGFGAQLFNSTDARVKYGTKMLLEVITLNSKIN